MTNDHKKHDYEARRISSFFKVVYFGVYPAIIVGLLMNGSIGQDIFALLFCAHMPLPLLIIFLALMQASNRAEELKGKKDPNEK